MKPQTFLIAPAVALGAMALAAGPAAAQDGVWQANLAPANNSGTAGQAMIEIHGQQATVSMNVSGAAEIWMNAPFPHGQHIHIGGQGVCPGPTADANGDGVVSSPEGEPFAGAVSTSLTVQGDTSPASMVATDRFPGGGAYTYERTLTLDAATIQAIQAGTATVEVHGVDPNKLPAAAQNEMSPEAPGLPLAATLPAACGTLVASQIAGPMPGQAPETGIETPVQTGENAIPLVAGLGVLLAAGTAAAAVSRRSASKD
jgi:hypothetical protein